MTLMITWIYTDVSVFFDWFSNLKFQYNNWNRCRTVFATSWNGSMHWQALALYIGVRVISYSWLFWSKARGKITSQQLKRYAVRLRRPGVTGSAGHVTSRVAELNGHFVRVFVCPCVSVYTVCIHYVWKFTCMCIYVCTSECLCARVCVSVCVCGVCIYAWVSKCMILKHCR